MPESCKMQLRNIYRPSHTLHGAKWTCRTSISFYNLCMKQIASTKFVAGCTTYCRELIALEQTLVAFPEWYLYM